MKVGCQIFIKFSVYLRGYSSTHNLQNPGSILRRPAYFVFKTMLVQNIAALPLCFNKNLIQSSSLSFTSKNKSQKNQLVYFIRLVWKVWTLSKVYGHTKYGHSLTWTKPSQDFVRVLGNWSKEEFYPRLECLKGLLTSLDQVNHIYWYSVCPNDRRNIEEWRPFDQSGSIGHGKLNWSSRRCFSHLQHQAWGHQGGRVLVCHYQIQVRVWRKTMARIFHCITI